MAIETKALFLQGPYSFFFRDLGRLLQEKGFSVTGITFHPGDSYLMRGLPRTGWRTLMKKFATEGDAPELETYYSARIKKLEKRPLSKKELDFFKAYYRAMKAYLEEERVGILLCHNDTRWQHAYALEAARRLHIPAFVFELGLFRPNTITMDPKGVNASNSVPRDTSFYRSFSTERRVNSEQTDSPVSTKKRNLIIALFLLFFKAGKISGLNAPENKVMRLRDYIRRFKAAYGKRRHEPAPATLPRRFFFIPFQVVNDSQTLLYSPYRDMETMAEDVIRAVKEFNKKRPPEERAAAVFKEHPMDRGAVSYEQLREKYRDDQEAVILAEGDINDLIDRSLGVVTINSTVGLDAISLGKKVMCIGQAFYAIGGIAFQGSPETLADDLEAFENFTPDRDAVRGFLHFLKDEYSMEGNEYHYNRKQLELIARRVVSSVKEGK